MENSGPRQPPTYKTDRNLGDSLPCLCSSNALLHVNGNLRRPNRSRYQIHSSRASEQQELQYLACQAAKRRQIHGRKTKIIHNPYNTILKNSLLGEASRSKLVF